MGGVCVLCLCGLWGYGLMGLCVCVFACLCCVCVFVCLRAHLFCVVAFSCMIVRDCVYVCGFVSVLVFVSESLSFFFPSETSNSIHAISFCADASAVHATSMPLLRTTGSPPTSLA